MKAKREMPCYDLEQLSVGYQNRTLIRDISVSIQPGEVVTLIGPNGAGKSTILKTIIGQQRRISGRIILEGKDIERLGAEEIAKKASVLLTGRVKGELMTNREIVETGRYPYTGRMGLLRQEDRRLASEAMQIAEVSEIAERRFDEGSDGQKQRVLFARALCQCPDVLVLDEPTSFLDIRHKLNLLMQLRRLAKEQGIAVIMSLHEIDLAQKASDRIICVKGDRIFRMGTPEEVFTEETIRQLYDLEEGAFDAKSGTIRMPKTAAAPRVEIFDDLQKEIRVRHHSYLRYGAVFASLIALCLFLLILNINTGNVDVALKDIFSVILNRGGTSGEAKIIWLIRLPRIFMAMLLGGALALSGFLLQTFFENPIAGPFILGISSGAKLTVALLMLGTMNAMRGLSSWSMIGAAFLGSLLSTGFILLISRRVSHAATLLVAGMMIGYICSAITDFLLTFAEDSSIVSLRGWSMGSFSGMNWGNVNISAVVIGLTFLLTFLLAKPIGAFQMGEGYARSMGVNVRRFRVILILLSSVLSACVTAFAGPISFVGIAVPYLTKQLLGTAKPLVVIPAVFLSGSAFCLAADLAARCAFAPTELNISTVTSLFGAPVVIFMMMRRRR